MKLRILNPKETVYHGDATSVFIQGDNGEFEILDYHAPVVSLLREGEIRVDGIKSIPVKKGIARFSENECVILVE